MWEYPWYPGGHYSYNSLVPYTGQYAEIRLMDGKVYHGQIVEVRPDGVVFLSSNPGFMFIPFLALWALSLPLAYGAGFRRGVRRMVF